MNTNRNNPGKTTIFSEIVNFFTEDSWYFVEIPEHTTLRLAFQGKNGKWNCYAQAKELEQQFVFYSIFPIQVPENKRLIISEFIARANYGMIIGNFELDFNDGEIRYKTSTNLEGNRDRLNFALIRSLVYTNGKIMDEYLPGMMSIISSDISPESVINQIELNQEFSNSLYSVDIEEKLVLNLSSETNLQTEEIITEKPAHLLTILTPEEIAQFHQALQIMPHHQRKQAEAIIEKTKKAIITRLGESGLETFTQAYNFFREVKIVIKNLKLIQRYSGIAHRTKTLLQNIDSENSQNIELSDILGNVSSRLEELPKDKIETKKEIELLIEIEEFRYQLTRHEKSLKKVE